MALTCETLLPTERTGLIEALRRDVQHQRTKAEQGTKWADYYHQNARMSIRILEAFGERLDPEVSGPAKSFAQA